MKGYTSTHRKRLKAAKLENIQSVQISQHSMRVNLDGDYYGSQFWKNFEQSLYEPDTISFIENRVNGSTLFFDIGAANGAITLLAACKGARVISYDPNPVIYKVLKNNVELNGEFTTRVTTVNCGVSDKSLNLNFAQGVEPTIISDIVLSMNKVAISEPIGILSLVSVLKEAHNSETVVIKMDIEGAEWRILHDIECLKSMKGVSATLLLAVHPGFYRPHKKFLKGLDRLSLEVFRIRNFIESVKIFTKIEKFASVKRTNLNPVTSRYDFALLITAGYHEFIFEF